MTVETRSLKFPMEWKAFVQVVVIIAMLIGASVAGVQVSMNVGIESRVEDIESRLDAPVNSSLSGLQKPYTEIVCMVDAYYVRQNGTDGRLILPYSTNKTYIQLQSLGNVTTGSVYLKEMTLASGLTYGSTVLVIQQYQGQLSYYSNSALIYTVKAGSLNVTTLYSVLLNSTSYYLSGQLLGFVQQASFIIDVSGSTYRAWHGSNSTLASQSTNASAVINNAIGNLTSGRTWYEKIFLKGNFTVDSPILLGNWTELCGTATIYMAVGYRGNIIQNLDRASVGNHHIYIHDLAFYGLYDDFSGQGNAIDLYNPTSFGGYAKPLIILSHLNFYKTSNYSISLYNLMSCDVRDIMIRTSKYGVLCDAVVDSTFKTVAIYSNDYTGLYLKHGTATNTFVDIYLGGQPQSAPNGQLYMYDADYNLFTNVRIDNSYDVAMEMADGSNYNQFTNLQITQLSQHTNATYNGITLTLASYNVFTNTIIARKGTSTYAHYAVQEVGASDYNIFIGATTIDTSVHNIVTVGTNSQVHLCYNGTTWVP